MPATSQKQKRFMNVVRLYKQGKIKNVGDAVKKAAESMNQDQVNDFAFTKGELPEKSPKKKKDNLNLELWAEENLVEDIWSIIYEETMVPNWLQDIPIETRYKILSDDLYSNINPNNDPVIEEVYRRINCIKSAKPLSQFPMGKAKRWPGESGATSSHGTFITGEKDYIKEQGKEPGQSIFSMRDYIKKVPYEKNKELEDSLLDNETETPYEKEKRDNPRSPRSVDILRRTSKSAQDLIKEQIQNKLKQLKVIK